jgi:valyl-tRNA synthetase
VKSKPLAEPALAAVREGKSRIIPEGEEKKYIHWMENIKDWCISRQIWWGHQIPAWHCAKCGGITVARQDPSACARCGANLNHAQCVCQAEMDPRWSALTSIHIAG